MQLKFFCRLLYWVRIIGSYLPCLTSLIFLCFCIIS